MKKPATMPAGAWRVALLLDAVHRRFGSIDGFTCEGAPTGSGLAGCKGRRFVDAAGKRYEIIERDGRYNFVLVGPVAQQRRPAEEWERFSNPAAELRARSLP